MASSADWFARKMAGQPAPTQAPRPSAPPVRPHQPSTPPVAPPPPAVPSTKAQSARQEDFCPECQSGNYMKAQGTNILRCFDCGYPIVQTTSGISGVKSEGPTRPARQPTGTQNNFNPGQIIGRIG